MGRRPRKDAPHRPTYTLLHLLQCVWWCFAPAPSCPPKIDPTTTASLKGDEISALLNEVFEEDGAGMAVAERKGKERKEGRRGDVDELVALDSDKGDETRRRGGEVITYL